MELSTPSGARLGQAVVACIMANGDSVHIDTTGCDGIGELRLRAAEVLGVLPGKLQIERSETELRISALGLRRLRAAGAPYYDTTTLRHYDTTTVPRYVYI